MGIYCVRLALLAIPMLLGTYFYYALLENWGLYYALACFVASLFCLPSTEGVEAEMKIDFIKELQESGVRSADKCND